MNCRTTKRFWLLFSIVALAAALVAQPPATFAQKLDDPLGVFQMDGNAVKDPGSGAPLLCFGTDLNGAPAESYTNANDAAGCPTLGSFAPVTFGSTTDDWAQVYAGSGGNYIAHSFDIDVAGGNSDPTTFLGTSTKDTDPISAWTWQAHSVQGKDDIEHAYAAAYNISGQTFLYAGMDRFANSGDSTAGFWFIQDSKFDLCTAAGQGSNGPNAACAAGGTFAGTHTNGDMLIVSDFSQGGAVSTVNIFIWNNGLSSTPNLTLSPAPCNPGVAGGTRNDVCGLVNNAYTQQVVHGKQALVPALVATGGWSFFDTKGNSAFATGEFLEVAVNLDNPHLFGSNPPCFSIFFAETRSSTSVSASLSDLVPPKAFSLCSVTPTKQCGISSSQSPPSTIVTLSEPNCTAGEIDAGKCNGSDVVRYYFSGTITSGKTLYHPMLTDNPPGVTQGGSYVAGSLLINNAAASPGVALDLLPSGTGFTSVGYTGQFDSYAILGDGDRNGISVTASSSSSPGGVQNVGPNTADWGPTKTSGCNPTPGASLEAVKLCNSCLTGTNNTLVVTVNEGVKVCNKGNVPINGVAVKDCQGAAWVTANGSLTCQAPGVEYDFPTVNLSQATTSGACHVFNNSYNPSSVAATCTSGTGCSTDYVIASGTIDSNFCTGNNCSVSLPAQVSQTCPLCPLGNCTTYPSDSTAFNIP
jgi:hypothetical protein